MKRQLCIGILFLISHGLSAQQDSSVIEKDGQSWMEEISLKKETRQWIFKHQKTKRSKIVKEGQFVKIVYLNQENKKRKVKGRWIKLTEDDLMIFLDKGETLSINKSSITKVITTPFGSLIKQWINESKVFILVVIGIAIILSSVIAAIYLGSAIFSNPILIAGGILFLLISAISISKSKSSGRSDFQKSAFNGGILYYFVSNHTGSIRNPFGGDWEVVYPFAETDTKEPTHRP